MEHNQRGFDYLFVSYLISILGWIFVTHGLLHFGILFLLLTLALLQEILSYTIIQNIGPFYIYLGGKDYPGFIHHSVLVVGILTAQAFIVATKKYISTLFILVLRKDLTKNIISIYLTKESYIALNDHSASSLDNPDQRITADVLSFAEKFCGIAPVALLAPFTISYYLWQGFSFAGWIFPVSCLSYFCFATLINKCLMSSLVNVSSKWKEAEGNYRFKHTAIRSHFEGLAFMNGFSSEKRQIGILFKSLLQVQLHVYHRSYILNLFIQFVDYIGSILSYLIIAIPIFNGFYDDKSPGELSSLISTNTGIVMYLISKLSGLVDLAEDVSLLSAVTHRIGEIHSKLSQNFLGSQLEGSMDKNTILKCSFLNVKTPDNKILVSNLNLEIFMGQNLLIMGRSSGGKTSLFRYFKGLWRVSEGSLEVNSQYVTMYVPQRPFLTNGSLLDLLEYPSVDKETLYQEFSNCDLTHLLDRFESISTDQGMHWDSLLSPGEIQRLQFIKIFLRKPQVVFLDEATSALSSAMESYLYQRCVDFGITLISISHRDNLLVHHRTLLQVGLDESGSWTLSQI